MGLVIFVRSATGWRPPCETPYGKDHPIAKLTISSVAVCARTTAATPEQERSDPI